MEINGHIIRVEYKKEKNSYRIESGNSSIIVPDDLISETIDMIHMIRARVMDEKRISEDMHYKAQCSTPILGRY